MKCPKARIGRLTPRRSKTGFRLREPCRGKRGRNQPQDPAIRVDLSDDAMFATDQGSYYDNTSEDLRRLDESSRGDDLNDDSSLNRPVLLDSYNFPGRIAPARAVGCWRDDHLIVEAIETLQGVLAGGPAADALQAFTIFLDNLGPSIRIPTLASSGASIEARKETLIGLSDDSVNLDDVHQSSHESGINQDPYGTDRDDDERAITCLPMKSKRRIDTEDADFSHVSSKRITPVKVHESFLISTTQEKDRSRYGDEDGHIKSFSQDCMVEVAAEVRLTYNCIKIDS